MSAGTSLPIVIRRRFLIGLIVHPFNYHAISQLVQSRRFRGQCRRLDYSDDRGAEGSRPEGRVWHLRPPRRRITRGLHLQLVDRG